MKTVDGTRKKRMYRVITAVLLVGWMAVIFWFSDQPATESSEMSGGVAYRLVETCSVMFGLDLPEDVIEAWAERIDHPVRKAAHMTEYAILGCLVLAALRGYFAYGKRTAAAALGAAAVYAATDEIHQIFIAGRAGRFSDVCIDTLGALFGLALVHFVVFCHRRHCEMRRHPVE